MNILKSKFLPQIVGIFGGVIVISGMLNFTKPYYLISEVLIILGFFIFGLSGTIIIKNKRYSLGFMEIKGIVAICYGALAIVIGWGLSIFFIIDYF